MNDKGAFRNLVKSIGYAMEGLSYAFLSQRNFRIQLGLGLLSLFLAYILGFSRIEFLILLLCICLVLAGELINTVFESFMDFKTEEFHPKVKIAKDLSASFVLLISIFVTVIGIFLFSPHILKFSF